MGEWRVEKGHFVLPSGNRMQASCHHRQAGACGGCYARLYAAVHDLLEAEDPKAVIRVVLAAMNAEGKARKAAR